MASKITMIFGQSTYWQGTGSRSAQRIAGFTESWYSSLASNATQLKEKMFELCELRKALLPRACAIIAQRVQAVNDKGEAGLSTLYERYFNGTYGTNDGDLPSKALCWYVRSTESPNHKMVILRGVPDSIVVEGEYKKVDAYQTAVNNYFQELNLQWKFKARVRTNEPLKIVQIAANGAFTLEENANFVTGDRVRLLRCYDEAGHSVTGVFKAAGVAAKAGTLETFEDKIGVKVVRGKVRKDEIAYPSPLAEEEELKFPDAINRKAGRPFKGFRGRRSAKS